MAEVVAVTKENFSSVVEAESRPVLMDFWAPWCGHCTQVAPMVEEVAEVVNDMAKCVKVNVDDNAHLAERFGIMMLPTLVVALNGKEVDRVVGVTGVDEILLKLENHIS